MNGAAVYRAVSKAVVPTCFGKMARCVPDEAAGAELPATMPELLLVAPWSPLQGECIIQVKLIACRYAVVLCCLWACLYLER